MGSISLAILDFAARQVTIKVPFRQLSRVTDCPHQSGRSTSRRGVKIARSQRFHRHLWFPASDASGSNLPVAFHHWSTRCSSSGRTWERCLYSFFTAPNYDGRADSENGLCRSKEELSHTVKSCDYLLRP